MYSHILDYVSVSLAMILLDMLVDVPFMPHASGQFIRAPWIVTSLMILPQAMILCCLARGETHSMLHTGIWAIWHSLVPIYSSMTPIPAFVAYFAGKFETLPMVDQHCLVAESFVARPAGDFVFIHEHSFHNASVRLGNAGARVDLGG
jgi:hypothetical protein